MSGPLAGGLLPLGPRTGSGTTRSSNTLTGGLVPIGSKSRPTATFVEEESRGAWDAEEGDPGRRKEELGNGLPAKKGTKISSSSKRRGGKEKNVGGHVSSKNSSRRRRGSKDPAKHASGNDSDANPTIAELGGSVLGRSSSSFTLNPAGAIDVDVEPEEEGDSYLFMGATAGAKAKKRAGKSAAEEALNYDSTDSFGLPKTKTNKGRNLDLSPRPTIGGSESRTTLADPKSGSFHVNPSTMRSAVETTGEREHDAAATSGDGNMPLGAAAVTAPAGATAVSMSPKETAAVVTSATGIDLDEDFDSSDEMDALLEMTDPSALIAGGSTASASATAAMPPLLQPGGVADSVRVREDTKNPRDGALGTAASTSAATVVSKEEGMTVGLSEGKSLSRRSPSPPSSPRKDRSDAPNDTRSGQSLRSRPGRGLTYSGSPDGSKYGGAFKQGAGSSSGQGLEDSSHGGTESRATNIVEEVPAHTAAIRTRSSIGPSLSHGSGGGERSRTDVDEIGGGVDDVRVESGARTHGSDLEALASVVSGDIIYGDSTGSLERSSGASDARRQLTSSGPGIVTKRSGRVPRRSALAGADKNKSQLRQPKPRGVTFDDDLVGVDALDILPGSSSDEGQKDGGSAPPTEKLLEKKAVLPPSPTISPATPVVPAEPIASTVVEGDDKGGGARGTNHQASEPRTTGSSSGVRSRSSTPITEGLSPAAARLMAEDSSSEDNNKYSPAGGSAIEPCLGLEPPDQASSAGGRDLTKGGVEKIGAESSSLFGPGPKDGGEGEDVVTDDAKLDLALGFTPSAMEGGRKPRRMLPAGRRRRSRGGEPPTKEEKENNMTGITVAITSQASVPSTAIPFAAAQTADVATAPLDNTALGVAGAAGAGAVVVGAAEDVRAAGSFRSNRVPGVPSTLPAAVGRPPALSTGVCALVETPVTAVSSTGTDITSTQSSAAALSSTTLAGSANDRAFGSTTISHGGPAPNSFDPGSKRGSSSNNNNNNNNNSDAATTAAAAASSRTENSAESGGVSASILASLERQLVLLAGEKEAAAARHVRDEERLQRDIDLARDATGAAQARAFESEAALAAARAHTRQLEAEAAEHTSRLAAVESRGASELRAEQESCLRKISDAETRHQDGLRKGERRHEEALSELKQLHREELEDTRRRNSDSKTLEALAGQVQASAGAVKLLQSEMMERKNVSDVSREGQMDARERLIKELEHSARRAQQTAEDEVQRLQGTLMAMDQVMSALRGQNAGERERLRQEHLRMEALQGAMVAEVEAVRNSVDEERQRLAERCAALDRDKRQGEAAARLESNRLAEQRVKLETERESFAALQVSASKAAEEMARRHAGEEERLNLARQSLEREASSLEARLSCARADLHKADHVRESLDRLRDQDELERRRLKALAGELERAFEEVRSKTDDIGTRQQEAEFMKAQALATSKAATQEKEAAQLRSARVEEAARRLDEERTSIAQARARSATELSTSRRLKAELSRALATQQRQQLKGTVTPADVVLSSRTTSLGLQIGSGSSGGGGDTGAGVGPDTDRHEFGGGKTIAKMPGLPPEVALEPADTVHAGAVGLAFTGIAAAEATLQAISSTPPFPGLDVGRELGRLARRAADLRECTREQSAFLSFSRAARFSPAPYVVSGTLPEPTTLDTGLQAPELFPGTPRLHNHIPGYSSHGIDVDAMLRQNAGGESSGTGGYDLGAVGIGLSSTVLEELDKIERACSQRSSDLKQEEQFVDTLGQAEGPVAA